MNKKILIQLSLFLIILIILVLTFSNYFSGEEDNKKNSKVILNDNLEKDVLENKSGSLIRDIKYVSSDINGNQYEISADYGELDIKNPDIIFMNKVRATIGIDDSNPITIFSDFAEYNSKTYRTKFSINVMLNYMDNKIDSEKIDLNFEKNIASISEKIIYTNSTTKLYADRLEIDLITKNSKIFMNSESKKIKIINNK